MPRKPKPIRIKLKKLRGYYGWAYPSEWRIELDENLKQERLLIKALHEIWHVLHHDLDESAVDFNSRVAADALWRLGFRRMDKDNE